MSKPVDIGLRVVVGLIVCGFAGYTQWVELHTDRNTWHELSNYGGFLFGAIAIEPRLLLVFRGFLGTISAAWKGRQ